MNYPAPLTTVDIVLVTILENQLCVLLQERPKDKSEPFPGRLALPGGFVHVQEDADLEETARRVVAQKTGISSSFHAEQLQTFSGQKRDPRGWSVSQAYCGIIPTAIAEQVSGWVPFDEALHMDLAFDHATILVQAEQRIRNKTNYSLLPTCFLEEEFTLTELQRTYETVLGMTLEKSAFRKKIDALGVFTPTKNKKQVGRMRPAQLFTVKSSAKLSVFRSNIR